MAGVLSPRAQLQINALGELLTKVQRVHALVEQYAAARVNQDQFAMPLKRALERLKLEFMGTCQDALSQLAGSLALAVSRGGSVSTRVRTLREGVGSMRFQLELEQRTIASADQEAQAQAEGETRA
jgi:hypothetical protein